MYPAIDQTHAGSLPRPPRLHWVFVLVLDVVSLGFFGLIWIFVQARWVRKVRGRSRTMRWLKAYVWLFPGTFVAVFLLVIVFAVVRIPLNGSVDALLGGFAQIASAILRLTAVYTLRNELAEEPIDLATSKIMAFFFGAIYFQYFLHDFRFDQRYPAIADSTLELSSLH